ncbi:MAG: class I SAM-dependent methyltransferase [Chloroflexi bacterium]|nr:class I SAM-dependent methyltransferase [Chloroflexota bacterium]
MSDIVDLPPICDYENSSYRTDFWEGQGRDYEDQVERIALKRLLPARGLRLVDIGCGFGRLAGLYNNYQHVILLDYSHSQLVYARQHWGDARFTYVAADIYRLPLAASAVDTAVMVRVMHHLADVPRALAQLRRILVPGGTLIAEFANKRHLKNRLRHLLKGGPDPNSPEPVEFVPLNFNFQPAWMKAHLREAGFDLHETLSVSLYRSRSLKKLLGAGLLSRLDGLQQRILAPSEISPSLFTHLTSPSAPNPVLAPIDKLFICPECQSGALERYPECLHCQTCGRDWPIVDGVYVFK